MQTGLFASCKARGRDKAKRIVWSSPALRRARTTNLIEKVTRASSKATHGTIVFFQTGHLTFKLPVRIGQAELKLEVPCAGRHGMDAAVCFFLGVFCSVLFCLLWRGIACVEIFSFFSPPPRCLRPWACRVPLPFSMAGTITLACCTSVRSPLYCMIAYITCQLLV